MRSLDAEWPDVNRDARLHRRCALDKVLASNSLFTLATDTSGIQEIPEMTPLTLPLPPSLPLFRVLAVWGPVSRHVCRSRRGGRCGRHSGRDAGGSRGACSRRSRLGLAPVRQCCAGQTRQVSGATRARTADARRGLLLSIQDSEDTGRVSCVSRACSQRVHRLVFKKQNRLSRAVAANSFNPSTRESRGRTA